MKHDHHGWHDPWEEMTPDERKYEKEHGVGAGTVSKLILVICVILWIGNMLGSCSIPSKTVHPLQQRLPLVTEAFFNGGIRSRAVCFRHGGFEGGAEEALISWVVISEKRLSEYPLQTCFTDVHAFHNRFRQRASVYGAAAMWVSLNTPHQNLCSCFPSFF